MLVEKPLIVQKVIVPYMKDANNDILLSVVSFLAHTRVSQVRKCCLLLDARKGFTSKKVLFTS